MKSGFLVIGVLGIVTAGLIFATHTTATEPQKIVFGSGPMGGAWTIGVGAVVQLFNEQLKDKCSFTVAASGGSIENMRRMIRGEYHTSWLHVTTMYDAWKGVGTFEGKPFKDFRVLEYITDQTVSVVTLTKYPIRRFKDLEGKRISIGPPGSGGIVIAHAVFKALGLTDKVKISMLTFEAGARALKDGQIDVSMAPGGPYVPPAILELSRTQPVRIVEPTDEEAKKMKAEIPYLFLGMIPPDKVPGENSDKERRAMFWSIFWCSQAGMADQIVYEMLRISQEPRNKEVLGKVLSYWLTAAPNFSSLIDIGIPLHPGAVKFWKEKGAQLPSELMK